MLQFVIRRPWEEKLQNVAKLLSRIARHHSRCNMLKGFKNKFHNYFLNILILQVAEC